MKRFWLSIESYLIFRSFLVCTFLLFSAPKLFPGHSKFFKFSIPYVMPLIQTFLTISVYAVIAIAGQGMIYVFKSQRNANHPINDTSQERGHKSVTASNYQYSSVNQIEQQTPQVRKTKNTCFLGW